MTLHYYAAEWPYGGRPSTTARRAGPYGARREITVPACNFVRFSSRTARDAWVADGPSYVGEPGFRESISTSSGYLRQAIRRAAEDLRADGYTTALSQVSAQPWSRRCSLEAISR